MSEPHEIAQVALANGLRLVLLRDPSLPIVAVNLWYHVGSKHDRPGRSGLAHLFEHMLFQGSAHVGTNDHFRHVQSVGGVANGSTWYDRTNYYETLPSPALDLGLWLESDRLGFLLEGITAEKLETQRQVVMNERRQRVDNQPYGRASERLFELLLPEGHPYRWPVIGTMAEIEAATLADVHQFFSTHYRPNNAVLSLVGDFESDAALAAAERWFGEIARGPLPPPVSASLPPLAAARRDRMGDRVKLPRLYLAFRAEPFATPGWWAGSLAASLLANGKSSPLVDDLVVARELAQDVSAYLYPTEELGIFVIVATARPGVELEAIEARIGEHLDRLAGRGGDAGGSRPGWALDAELARARRRTLVAIHSEIQSVDQRADLLSQYATFFGDPARAFREPAEVAAVDADRVRRFAAERLGPDQRATLYVDPVADGAP